MRNFFRILLITLIAFLIGGISIYFGIKTYNSKNIQFKNSGYVISVDDGKKESSDADNGNITSTKFFFDGSESFRKGYSNDVTFKDTSKDEINVASNNFIHYNDGSIGAFKVTSLVNLDDLDADIIKYYNLPVGSQLTKSGNNYVAKALSNNIEFSNLLLKIDENKYMILSDDITVKVGDETKEINNSYLEVTFFDGNIARLENNDIKIQNIADSMYLYLDNGVTINLSTKNIFLNKTKKLNMQDITITSDDNINLEEEEEEESSESVLDSSNDESTRKAEESKEREQKLKDAKDKAEKEKAEEKLNNNDNNTAIEIGENPLNGINNGVVNPAKPDSSEEIVDDKNEYDPVFTISNLDISPNGITTEITHEDKSGVLKGSPTLTLINAETNKIVDKIMLDDGLSVINYENKTLTQNTNYVLVINSDYTKNGETLNKDFIQKAFITSPIGVNVNKDYFTEDSLNFEVTKDSNSKVQKLSMKLLDDSGTVLKTEEVDFNAGNNIKESFEGLKPNTKYTIRLDGFMFDSSIVSDTISLDETFTTLKRTPTIGGISYSIDKVNGKFVLGVDNVQDRDNSIKNIRYEIYDARSISEDNDAKPIKTINKNSFGSVDVNVDDTNIERGKPYVFKAIAEFNDNEKIVELENGYSDVFQLDGKVHPTVRFDKENVTFERIKGTLNIVDEYGTVDYTKPITIVYSDSHGISNTITFASASSKIPIDINGLRANNETYTFNVYGTIDLGDNYGAVNQLIGTFVVNTNNIKSFTLSSKVDKGDISNVFSIKARLTPTNNEDNTLEANTLTNLTFNLYNGSNTSGRKIKSVSVVDFNDDPYESDLKPVYYDKTFTITPSTFGLTNSYLKTFDDVTIEVTNANDYTKWPNTSPIIDNVITVKIRDVLSEDDEKDKITYKLIRNKDVNDSHHDDKLLPNTYVGVEVQSTYDNASRYARYVNYYLFDKANPNTPVASKEKIPVNDDGTIPSYTFYLKNGTSNSVTDKEFTRGNTYFATYVINIDYDGDGVVDTDKQIPLTGVYASSNFEVPKQEPIFETYPSSSDGKTLKWNYKYVDADNALITNKVYFKINNIDIGMQEVSQSDKFQTLSIPFNRDSSFDLYTYMRLLKDSDKDDVFDITSQDIAVPTKVPDLNFVITEEVNRIILTIPNFNDNKDFFNKVTDMYAIFSSNGTNKTIDNLTVDDTGNIIIDLYDLKDFMNQSITVNLYANYDSNKFGFDAESGNNFVLREANDGIGTGNYYYTQNNQLYKKTTAYNTAFAFDLNRTPNASNKYPFSLEDKINKVKNDYYLSIDGGGFMFPNEASHFYPSAIDNLKFNIKNNSFTFKQLVPGVSVKDTKNGKYMIDPGLNNATVKAIFSGDLSDIKDNQIYVELYKTDENMLESNSKLVGTTKYNINDFAEGITIENLDPSSFYYFKLYVDLKSGGKIELYDVDEKNNTTKYPIQTLGNIKVKDSTITYSADSYEEKHFILRYSLDKTTGIDHISYKLCKVIMQGDNLVYTPIDDVEISDSVIVSQNNEVSIDIPPSKNVQTGNLYAVRLTAYLKKSNGELVELDPIYSNNTSFTKLADPYIYIKPTRNTSDNSITYAVRIIDTAKVMVNGEYKVKFESANNTDITPEKYKATYNAEKEFTIDNINLQESNYITVSYNVNQTNSSSKDDIVYKETRLRVTPLSSEGINVGTVYATTNQTNKSKVNLIFSGSSKLNLISKIRYVIIKNTGEQMTDTMTENLNLTSSSCGNSTCYQTTLSSIISSTGIYYIQIQFIDNMNKVVDEKILDYVYTI